MTFHSGRLPGTNRTISQHHPRNTPDFPATNRTGLRSSAVLSVAELPAAPGGRTEALKGAITVVMGPTHAMSGAAAGLAVAQLLPDHWGGVTTPQETFIYAGLTAGAALLPDLDSPSATVSRSFGPITQLMSRAVENTSQGFVNLTRSRKDPRCNNGHRTLTHTVWFMAAAGAGATALIGIYGKVAAIALLFIFLGLAIRGLLPEWSKKNDWLVVTAASAVLTYGAWYFVPDSSFGLVMGSAVAVGVAAHLLGDMATKQGIPAFGPIVPWRGRRWWKLRLPRLLRITAGGPADKLMLSAFTFLVVVQIGLVATGNMSVLMTNLLGG